MKSARSRLAALVIPALVVAFLPLATLPAFAAGELSPKVRDIRSNINRYLNERVRIEGYVTQYVEAGSRTTAFYYLKDDWGGLIRVRTSDAPPAVGKRYAVVGPVGFDPRNNDPYISQEKREELQLATEAPSAIPTAAPSTWVAQPAPAQAAASAQPSAQPAAPAAPEPEPAVEPTPAPPQGLSTGTVVLLVVLVAALVAIVVALALVLGRKKKSRPGTSDFTLAASQPAEAAPAPQQVIEGRTIKMHAPPPNTIKLLPGYLEVLSGDDAVKEIRFYKLKGEAVPETTFGRATGRPYVHIQLKPMTISSRQAKLSFDQGQVKLTNFASNESNPTKVNGRDLGVDEMVVLKDGDRIDMGEVAFKFHGA